ncbi:MAG: NUDIX hydrolase [Kofleriaceae bacterium]|nr:NUDIX hydrolase [Myxococcales bacterium]MCB9562270.1 NUDIX hydrolase [Kofleriaceae bacterium]
MLSRAALLVVVATCACGSREATPPGAGTGSATRPPTTPAPPPPLDLAGGWSDPECQAILGRNQTVTLAPDLTTLTEGERAAVARLREAGDIFQDLYEDQRHHQAAAARAALAAYAGPEADAWRQLYRLFKGPIATTLDNQREAFLPVDPIQPGKTVYPDRITKDEIEAYLTAHPEARAALLAPRTVVRRATAADATADLATLDRHPALDTLHPDLRARLDAVRTTPTADGLYALPYAVAYADPLDRAYHLLFEAADLVEADDPELAGYLRNRGRDLLSDDYESGDAAWVTGHFRHLNAQIGSYETYDDELYGAKTFFSTSILIRRPAESDALAAALASLQAFEDALPYAHHKKVRERIPVGVYDVIADYGQARGGNTASILPNEAYLARRHGRTILLRGNIMRDPTLFGARDEAWQAVVAPAHAAELTGDGSFYRTLWHEVGHYLGVDTTRDGRTLDLALEDDADLLEEMKADLVALEVAPALRAQGYYDDAALRSVYASGILRVLQNNKPRRDQPYQTMQLIQWNYFLELGLLRFDAATGTLAIDYARYHDAVASLLAVVLDLQYEGDKAAADAFITRYTTWDDAVHGVVAQRLREHQRYRYTQFQYR